MKTNYDYSKTMMMKIMLAKLDGHGGSKVNQNFESALEIIKQVDNITMGCKKILYLVGWQYLGHDDKYPAFFEVNENLKRKCDDKALDSLLWLIEEGKKYNTTVSLHINLTDAYPSSPLWEEYESKDLIIKNMRGKLKPTGVWEGQTAYQVDYAKELKSGCFYKRVDKLLDCFPPKTFDTLHVDAFFVCGGKGVNIAEEKSARKKMVEYLNSKGVDITSEIIYREGKHGYKWHHGDSDMAGVIPAFWNPVYSRKIVLKYPANVLAGNYHSRASYEEAPENVKSGTRHASTLTPDESIGWLVYGNIWGENLFLKKSWQEDFIKEFATFNLPYFFLNNYKRIKIEGMFKGRKLIHSDGVVSAVKNKTISQDGVVLKQDEEIFLPIDWLHDSYALYTNVGGEISKAIKATSIKVLRVTADGENEINDYKFDGNTLTIQSPPKCLYKVVVSKKLFSAVDSLF